jgi:hypothetical protein
MVQLFGEFSEEPLNGREYLTFGFVPNLIPQQQRWRNNGLLADILANYSTTFFSTDDSDPKSFKKQNKFKGVVSHIANELLENAVKFNDETSDSAIKIQFHLHRHRLILCVTNSVPPGNVDKFQSFIQDLLNTDLDELYLRQMTVAVEDESMTSSGLGLLMMISGYGAKLGWKFEMVQKNPERIAVTTMVQLVGNLVQLV